MLIPNGFSLLYLNVTKSNPFLLATMNLVKVSLFLRSLDSAQEPQIAHFFGMVKVSELQSERLGFSHGVGSIWNPSDLNIRPALL